MVSRRSIKFRIILFQNLTALLIIGLWFFLNYLVFFIQTGDFFSSLQILFYFKQPITSYELFYSNFTEFIIFGSIFTLITVELFRKYNPEETSRKLAKAYYNHAIIIGYNNIGKRIAMYFKEMNKKFVIIDKDRNIVLDLIEAEEPVINDNVLNIKTLLDAGIDKAKAVYVMSDDLELQFVVNSYIRQKNNFCKLICRIFEDDIAEIISKTYNAYVISTSKYTANIILDKIKRKKYKNILLIGINHITSRLVKNLSNIPDIKINIIGLNRALLDEIEIPEDLVIIGDPKDENILEKVDIKEIDFVFNSDKDPTNSILITKKVRDYNRKCKIYSRFFQDAVADILEQPPFNSKVISSSKYALKIMKKREMLNI